MLGLPLASTPSARISGGDSRILSGLPHATLDATAASILGATPATMSPIPRLEAVQQPQLRLARLERPALR